MVTDVAGQIILILKFGYHFQIGLIESVYNSINFLQHSSAAQIDIIFLW